MVGHGLGDHTQSVAVQQLRVGLGLGLPLGDTGGQGGHPGGHNGRAAGGCDVLADVLDLDVVAGHLDVVTLGDGLGDAALALDLLDLGGAGGGVVGDVGSGVGEGVAGEPLGVRLGGGQGTGGGGEEEDLGREGQVTRERDVACFTWGMLVVLPGAGW